jgi:ankyrin repeat protein
MSLGKHPPTRALRNQPDLSQLRRQAKELLKAFTAGDADAIAEVDRYYRRSAADGFALHHAQLVIARSHGFDSWPKLKAYVDGVTVGRLVEAVRAGDVVTVTSMLSVRPELVDLDVSENDEHRALHHAVLQRQPEMVRLLMRQGSDARKGIWPHRDATSALRIATDREYTEIVEIIRDEEERRSGLSSPLPDVQSELAAAFHRGDESTLIRIFERRPELIRASDPGEGMTALHWAAARVWDQFAGWLLAQGADAKARSKSGQTPLDLLGSDADSRSPQTQEMVTKIGQLLLRHGGERTIRSAVAMGESDWLRARLAEGGVSDARRLVSLAVASDRPEVLRLLLESGLDPDERERVEGVDEVVFSWGGPIRECALAGDAVMAEILLERGADPNTNVYAASSAMYVALARDDSRMVQLFEKHGGVVDAGTAASLGLTDRVRLLLDEEDRVLSGEPPPCDRPVAQMVLEAATASGRPDLVRRALARLDWPPGDPRWQGKLMQAFGAHEPSDRERYLECFRAMLERSGIDLPGRFGRTLLHDVAASWPRSSPMRPDDRLAFATILLETGARLDVRDDLLKSTPLGWACRWGRVELVDLLLQWGADPVEPEAEPWATPRAWAEKMTHDCVLSSLGAAR